MSDELPLTVSRGQPETFWFAPRCCVVVRGEQREVLLGGRLLGSFGPGDFAGRNVALVTLGEQPDVHLGKLAAAFGITTQTIRVLRRAYERGGLEAVVHRKQLGRPVEVSARTVKRLETLFSRGASITEAFVSVGPAGKSRATVGRMRQAWAESQTPADGPQVSEEAAQAAAEDAPLESAPDSPLSIAFQNGSTPFPMGVITPIPVTTTLCSLFIFVPHYPRFTQSIIRNRG